MSQQNFAQLVLGVQHGPNTLEDQLKFIQRRIPSQASPAKEAILTEHIRTSLKLIRETSAQMATPFLKAMVSKLSKTKEKTAEADFFMDIMPSLTDKIGKLQKSHNYVASLESSTRIALGKSLAGLNIPMMMKPISLLGRFAEAVE